MSAPMKKWPVQDAKARFSEMLDQCIANGPQLVTRRGEDAAVLVPLDQWRAIEKQELERQKRPTLKDILLAPEPRFDLELPERGRFKRRPPPEV